MSPEHQILAQILQELSAPLEPKPTGFSPWLGHLEGIQAVVFDIYGTLIISGSGDISLAQDHPQEDAMRAALRAVGLQPGPEGRELVENFHAAIREAQDARRAQGVTCPEVDIREVWWDFIETATEADHLATAELTDAVIDRLAIEYEARVNPVWPMPHLAETLATLRERGLTLGIVSNAQFYTPLMFPAFLHQSLEQLGFPPDNCLYSFALREAKPSTRPYALLAERLEAQGIAREKVLYVGNDMRNDIRPAQLVGFKAGLFAGDERSLRMREGDVEIEGVTPDIVVTELPQIIAALD